MNAFDVLGQGGSFTTNTGNGSSATGLRVPSAVAVDMVHHRLFVGNNFAPDLFVYNLDVNNVLVDRTADFVLGAPDFGGPDYSNNSYFDSVDSLAYDPTGDRLFVGDASPTLSRVLVFDTATITNNENAVNVLGQTSINAVSVGTGNVFPSSPTASNMRPVGMAFDDANDRLFVADPRFGAPGGGSQRVLVFNVASITDNEAAVNVLGQPDFTTNTTNTQNVGNGCTTTTNACGLSQPGELAYDSANQRLFVADGGNSRVAIFNVSSIANGEAAVNVLGQTSLTDGSSHSASQSQFGSLSGLGHDSALQRLFVGGDGDNRTLMFDVAAITNGENAVNVIGQANFTATGAATTQSGQSGPDGVAYGSNNVLYVVDASNNRVLLYDGAPAAPAGGIEQNAYRWRNDDGSESTATFAAAENTPLATFDQGVPKRLRLGAANDGNYDELLREAVLSVTGNAAIPANLSTAVIDTANGYAYFGANGSPGKVVKVALGSGTTAPSLVATLTLNSGENNPSAAVIDTANGFAYFATNTAPMIVVKVALGAGAAAPTRVTAITLNSGESNAQSGLIDTTNGYAYFSTDNPRVVKVDINPSRTFVRIGAATLTSFMTFTRSAVIDTANGYAYYGSGFNGDGQVAKVALGAGAAAPSETATITLNPGENGLTAAMIDTANGYAYFGTSATSPAKVIKVALGAGAAAPSRTAALTLNAGEDQLIAGVGDPANGFAYFATGFTSPGKVTKVALGAGAAAPTRIGSVTLNAGENNLYSGAVIDTVNGYGYFGTQTTPGIVVKVTLGSGSNPPTRLNATTSVSNVGYFLAAVIDEANGYAYFCDQFTPANVIKIRLSDFTVVDRIALTVGNVQSGVIDTVNGFAYFGTGTSPAKIAKVDINPSNTFAETGSITLSAGLNSARSAVIDVANGFAYFGLFMAPGKVVKVDINPSNTFAATGSVTFTSGRNNPRTAAIDTAAGFAYFGTLGTTCGGCTAGTDTFVVKVALSSFTEAGAIGLESQSVANLRSAVIDPTGGTHFAYFGDQDGHIAKINLSSFTYVGKITDSDGIYLSTAVIDTANGFAYFGSSCTPFPCGGPETVYKIDLGTFTEVDKVQLNAGEGQLFTSVIDTLHGYAYFGTDTDPGIAVKVSIAPHAQFRLEYGVSTSTCSAVSSWTQVGAPAGGETWVMSNSSNITNGAATTDNAGLTNGNPSFQPGEIHDTTSQTGPISLGEKQFTELEFNIKAAASAPDGTAYCFRLTDAGSSADFTYTEFGEPTNNGTGFGVASGSNNPTLSNKIVLSRAKAGVSSTVDIFMTLQGTLSGTLTVTFPVGFTVTAAATGGSACLSGFGFTSSTLTATKTNCSGAIGMTGATATNPSSPGIYQITWINDDPGGGSVIIVSDDQVNVTAAVDPVLTFNVGAQASATACAGSFAGNGGTVALGSLTTASVASSDTSSVNHICTRLTTNAANGAIVTVRSLNASLKSASVPADTIPSSTTTLVAGTAGYGLCAGSAGADSGFDVTTPAGVSPVRSTPYNGSCTSSAHDVGALTTGAQNIWTVADASQNAFVRLYIKAAISSSTPAHSDYTDTLTFVATGTF